MSLKFKIVGLVLLVGILLFATRSDYVSESIKSIKSASITSPSSITTTANDEYISRKAAIKRLKIEPLGVDLRSPKWDPVTNPGAVEDRAHIQLLATHLEIPTGVRKIYIDFGLQVFDSSIQWMEDHYPMQFDQIYGFEAVKDVFFVPQHLAAKYAGRLHYYNKFVTTHDSETTVDAVRFLNETIQQGDFVVLKMDIENEEWNVLPAMEKAGLFDRIDEFFCEIHFKAPNMVRYDWDKFAGHTREDARALIEKYRAMGVYAHYWP